MVRKISTVRLLDFMRKLVEIILIASRTITSIESNIR
jgi:hypothetical protein